MNLHTIELNYITSGAIDLILVGLFSQTKARTGSVGWNGVLWRFPCDEDLMKSGWKCQKQKMTGVLGWNGVRWGFMGWRPNEKWIKVPKAKDHRRVVSWWGFFCFFVFLGAYECVGLSFCKLLTLKKLMVLHLCNLCQGDWGAGVWFEFLMIFSNDGLNGNALVVDFEEGWWWRA